jgi:hypothetical protein
VKTPITLETICQVVVAATLVLIFIFGIDVSGS